MDVLPLKLNTWKRHRHVTINFRIVILYLETWMIRAAVNVQVLMERTYRCGPTDSLMYFVDVAGCWTSIQSWDGNHRWQGKNYGQHHRRWQSMSARMELTSRRQTTSNTWVQHLTQMVAVIQIFTSTSHQRQQQWSTWTGSGKARLTSQYSPSLIVPIVNPIPDTKTKFDHWSTGCTSLQSCTISRHTLCKFNELILRKRQQSLPWVISFRYCSLLGVRRSYKTSPNSWSSPRRGTLDPAVKP